METFSLTAWLHFTMGPNKDSLTLERPLVLNEQWVRARQIGRLLYLQGVRAGSGSVVRDLAFLLPVLE